MKTSHIITFITFIIQIASVQDVVLRQTNRRRHCHRHRTENTTHTDQQAIYVQDLAK